LQESLLNYNPPASSSNILSESYSVKKKILRRYQLSYRDLEEMMRERGGGKALL